MVLSQEKAKQIAIKLCEKKKESVSKLLAEYQQFVHDSYVKQTPTEIISMQKKYPDWFSTSTGIYLHGNGFNNEYVNTSKAVIDNTSRSAYMKMDNKLASQISQYKNAYLKAKDNHEDLVREIKTALINLKTFSRITEKFPEAAALLPKSTSTAIMVNVDGIRKKLKAA